MSKTLINTILVICVCAYSCKAQNIKKTENTFELPKITKEFEKFDVSLFKSSKSNSISKIHENVLEKFVKAKVGYSELNYFNNSSFIIIKNFYKNGNIEIKGIRFNNGSEYGIWYEFDKEGKRIAAIDTDIGYDYGWDDILAYCKENNIPLTKGYPERGGIKTEIHKDEEGGKKVWTLRYNNNKTFQYLEVTLDGRTGAVLNQRELEFH